MDFKQQHFRTARPNTALPATDTLSTAAASELRRRIAARLGLSTTEDTLAVVQAVAAQSTKVAGVSVQSADFALTAVLELCGVTADRDVYVDWYRFDDMTRVSLGDLTQYFDDFWYAGPDAIAIFDHSVDWILSIDYDGAVKLLRMP